MKTKKVQEITVIQDDLKYSKKDIKDILKEAKSINYNKMAEEILIWLTKNVENYISNQETKFKLDIILDNDCNTIEDMEELKKLQDLYRAIPDDEFFRIDQTKAKEKENFIVKNTEVLNLDEINKARETLDLITERTFIAMNNKVELLENLYKRMVFYYELKGVNKGQLLLQKLDGKVAILRFEYEPFSVGVKIRDPQKEKVVKEYIIPEGFSIILEIAFSQVKEPTSLF